MYKSEVHLCRNIKIMKLLVTHVVDFARQVEVGWFIFNFHLILFFSICSANSKVWHFDSNVWKSHLGGKDGENLADDVERGLGIGLEALGRNFTTEEALPLLLSLLRRGLRARLALSRADKPKPELSFSFG